MCHVGGYKLTGQCWFFWVVQCLLGVGVLLCRVGFYSPVQLPHLDYLRFVL